MSAADASFPVLSGAEAFRAEGAATGPEKRRRCGLGVIHGFSGSPVSMRPLAEALAGLGFRVDVPRLPGHGTDPRDMARTRYPDWRGEVDACVDRLQREAEHVLLIGLSMGGTLCLDVASRRPEIRGVVCINPQLCDREGVMVKLSPLFAKVMPLAPAALAGLKKDDIAKPGVSERAYDYVSVAAGNSLLAALPDVRAGLTRLDRPLLVAHSAQDHSVPKENSEALLRLVPHARELLLERSYHVATLDYDFEILRDRIRDFCDEVLERAS